MSGASGRATPTPCIGICSTTSFGDLVCRGCKRFAQEVVDWNAYDEAQKLAVEQRLQRLLLQALEGHLRVRSDERLAATLERLKIRYLAHRPPLCWSVELMRNINGPCSALAAAGLEAATAWQGREIAELSAHVNESFRQLSLDCQRRALADAGQTEP